MFALCAAAGAAWAAEAPSPGPARVVTGEVTRVDLGRRSVSVRPEARDAARADGAEAREVDAGVGPDTRLVSRGRVLRLEDLRSGDRVVLVFVEEGGRRLARVVRVTPRVIRIESVTR
jgi:hypothetical protein